MPSKTKRGFLLGALTLAVLVEGAPRHSLVVGALFQLLSQRWRQQ